MKKPVLLAMILAVSIASSPAVAESGGSVFVSILPQKYFVQKIGGELVDVNVMVSPGSSPATYEPSPRQMAELAGAKAYFAVGVPFEKSWLPRIASANPDMPVIHTDEGIDKMPISAHEHHHYDGEAHGHAEHKHEAHGHAEHKHEGHVNEDGHHDKHHHDAGHGHKHHQGMPDPHIWLAPELVRIQAKNIYDGLVRIHPENKQTYSENLADFIREIDVLDRKVEKILAPLPEEHRTFMVFHPTWGYFARQYGLEQIAIESGGKEPGPGELTEIIKLGRELGIKAVFVQPQFSQKSASVIARELDAEVVSLDPLSPDWDDNMIKAAEAFGRAASKSGN